MQVRLICSISSDAVPKLTEAELGFSALDFFRALCATDFIFALCGCGLPLLPTFSKRRGACRGGGRRE